VAEAEALGRQVLVGLQPAPLAALPAPLMVV
jgi:hypothetical protein